MKNRVRIIKKEFKVDEKNKVVVCELLFTLQLLGSEAIPNIMDIPGRMAKEAISMGDTLVCREKPDVVVMIPLMRQLAAG